MKRNIIRSVILLFLPVLCFAQSLEYNIRKPSKLYIGTPFHILVDITANDADSIFSPQIDTLDIFILKDEITQSEEIIEGKKTTKLDLTFQPFDTGEFTFPELEFAVKKEDSLLFLQTNEFQLNIESIINDSTQSIKDIAEPLKISLGFWDYFFPLVAICLLILIITYLVRLWKRRNISSSEPVIIDERPAYIIALEMLELLKKDKLLEKGDFLIFYFQLSYILRFFIELFYKTNAVEMTTSEIRQNLQIEDFKQKSKILDFLTFADKIKFARFIPKIKESKSALKWLEEYLRSFENKQKNLEETVDHQTEENDA